VPRVFSTPDKGDDIEHQVANLKRRNGRRAGERRRALESPLGVGTTYPRQRRHCARAGCPRSWEAVTRRRDARYCTRRCKEKARC
jgi:hypothetical protein